MLRGHHGRVLRCAWNLKDNSIISWGVDHTFRIWDLKYSEAGNVEWSERNLPDPPASVARFSKMGRFICVGYSDGSLRVEPPDQALDSRKRWALSENDLRDVRWVGEDRALVTLDESNMCQLVTMHEMVTDDTQPPFSRSDIPGQYSAICELGSKEFATADKEGTISIWNADSCKVLHKRKTQFTAVNVMANCEARGLVFVGGHRDSKERMEIRDSRTLELKKVVHLSYGQPIQIACDIKGQWLAVVVERSEYGAVIVYDIVRKIRELNKWYFDEVPRAIAVSPDGRVLCVGHRNGEIQMRSIPKGQLLATTRTHVEEIRSIDFSSDGSIVVSSSVDSTVVLREFKMQSLA